MSWRVVYLFVLIGFGIINISNAVGCGDFIIDPGEECDDGNSDNFDDCRNNCMLPYCGDGIFDRFEACDDGNFVNCDECPNNCMYDECGDGIDYRCNPFWCDDGNRIDRDGCSSICEVETEYCGDGILQEDQCEECDDGNRVNGDGCDRDCIIEAVAPKQCDAYTCEAVKYKAQLLDNLCRIGERCKDEFTKCDMRPFKKIKDFTLPRSCKKWLRCQTKWTDFEQGGAVVGELGTGCQCELLPKSQRYGFRDGDDFTPEPAGSTPAATCAQHLVELTRLSNTAVMIAESRNWADITWGFISGKTTPTITKVDPRNTQIEGMKKNGEYVFSMTISSLWSSNSVPTLCFRHSVFRFTR